ncbi:MAG: hypothetical protein ACLTTP_00935 [Alistipes ihumii]
MGVTSSFLYRWPWPFCRHDLHHSVHHRLSAGFRWLDRIMPAHVKSLLRYDAGTQTVNTERSG